MAKNKKNERFNGKERKLILVLDIKSLREKSEMTQKELSEQSGVPIDCIQYFESDLIYVYEK